MSTVYTLQMCVSLLLNAELITAKDVFVCKL